MEVIETNPGYRVSEFSEAIKKSIYFLYDTGVSIDTEFGRYIFSDVENATWSDDFGGKLTLLTFAVINSNKSLAEYLIANKANVEVTSLSKKTLLMYALENDDDDIALMILNNLKKPQEVVNVRDCKGLHAFHYLMHENKYGGFRYDERQIKSEKKKCAILMKLIKHGADLDAMINGDPDTLILNMAAYRNCCHMLQILLPLHTFITNSEALSLATHPIDDLTNLFRVYDSTISEFELTQRRTRSIELIMSDLINRWKLGLPVPTKEIKLFDKLIANDTVTQLFVNKYMKTTIQGFLNDQIVADTDLTFYQLAKMCLKDRDLRICVQHEERLEYLKNILYYVQIQANFNNKIRYFTIMLDYKIEQARERNKLSENYQKIQDLKTYIPLSDENIYFIVEYLSNNDLKNFINSFCMNM